MKQQRPQEPSGAGRALLVGGVAAAAFVTFTAVANAALLVAVARKVITPPTKKVDNVRILAVAGKTVTLSVTEETRTPGAYSLWFSGDTGHARIGAITDSDAQSVTREVLGVDFGDIASASRGRIGSWVFRGPGELGLPWSELQIETDVGPAPAWLIPAEEPTGKWVIAVHGRGVQKSEALRAVDVFHRAGYTALLVSYRNDGEAPGSPDGLYALGDTEWNDVDAALSAALGLGATDVVMMGWSMGGATVLQLATRSTNSAVIRGVVLESPVVDWNSALTHQGRKLGLANPFRYGVLSMLSHRWGVRLTGLTQPIDLGRLDFVSRAAELRVPVLLLHSSGDSYVPVDASRELARLRPDIVTYDEFSEAGHTRLWNYDPERWTADISRWLSRLPQPNGHTGNAPHPSGAASA